MMNELDRQFLSFSQEWRSMRIALAHFVPGHEPAALATREETPPKRDIIL
jgi:hypothetical protein